MPLKIHSRMDTHCRMDTGSPVRSIWWLFPVWVVAAVIFGVMASRYYYRSVAYICPQCHEVFKPSFKEMFWARHTPKTRKLTCVKCGHHGYCVETWAGAAKEERA